MVKTFSIWFHIWFWVIYTIVYTILGAGYKNDFEEAFILELLNLPMRLIICYFNYFLLLPLLINKNQPFRYVAYTILSLLIAGFVQRIFNYEALSILYPNMPDFGLWLPYKFLQSVFLMAAPMVFLIGITSISKMAETQKKARILENEKLQAELKYLRSQISPHFLFNTLNHIYGLSLERSKKVPELILKLSDFLSFSLYESKQGLIPLKKEIDLLKDFMALETSRFDDRINITIILPQEEDLVGVIPPFILVPFVENAFKHGLNDKSQKVFIHISLEIVKDCLHFMVRNSKDPQESLMRSNRNGLGLVNIKKRLDIIYGKSYDLHIDNSADEYIVNLKITRK
ncbi:MAG: sensor histidine kinase [Xanthomarina gelatinilytica]|uniref:sensor histidine kinase n=1 Tax=Xanthomarina gelatinilytica TaxID=1137281 RepID=UPI003A84935F